MTSTVIRRRGCKTFKTAQRRLFFTRADMSMLDHCLRHFSGSQSKTGFFFKIDTFLFRFFCFLFFVILFAFAFDGTQPPYLSSCMYVYTPSRTLRSSLAGKETVVQDGDLKVVVTGRSLFRLSLSGTTFLLTSSTAVHSHSSELLFKLFSLFLPALSCSNPLTGIEYCT